MQGRGTTTFTSALVNQPWCSQQHHNHNSNHDDRQQQSKSGALQRQLLPVGMVVIWIHSFKPARWQGGRSSWHSNCHSSCWRATATRRSSLHFFFFLQSTTSCMSVKPMVIASFHHHETSSECDISNRLQHWPC